MVMEFDMEFYGILWNFKGAFILQIHTDEKSLYSHYFYVVRHCSNAN